MDDWMQKFEKLYLQGNAKEAFDLRQKHLPPKLYRYRSCQSSKDLLRRINEMEGFIHFSNPSELNDPFESCCLCGNDAEDFEAFLSSHMISTKRSILNDEIRTKLIEHSVNGLYDETNKFIRAGSRIACFSTEKDNVALWAHYADQFKGFCFEYHIEDLIKQDWNRILYPVLYKNTLPDLMAHIKKPSLLSPYVCINKLNVWSYEHEWRLFFDARNLSRDENIIERKFTVPFCKPRRILIGSRIDPKLKEFITKSAKLLGINPILMVPTPRGLCEHKL